MSVGALAAVLIRLPAQLADPAAAWPAAVRRQLPGAAGFYVALALRCCAAVAGCAFGLGLRRTLRGTARGPGGRPAASCARSAARRAVTGWRSAATTGGCCTPSSATHWSRSGRRSRASRPGLRFRRCWNGTARRSPRRSRPICSRARSSGAVRSARCSCSTRSRSRDASRTPGRRCGRPTRGTARSRSRGGWRPRASSTSAASRAATSGRSRPSSGWRRCCSRPPPAGRDGRGRPLGLRSGGPGTRRDDRAS